VCAAFTFLGWTAGAGVLVSARVTTVETSEIGVGLGDGGTTLLGGAPGVIVTTGASETTDRPWVHPVSPPIVV
jgi:hypothetical protein